MLSQPDLLAAELGQRQVSDLEVEVLGADGGNWLVVLMRRSPLQMDA